MTQIIIGLISVAKESRLVNKAMLELHFQSITKRNNAFLYHLEVRRQDGIEYVEQRRNRLNSKSIYLIHGWTRYPEMLDNLKEHLRTRNM